MASGRGRSLRVVAVALIGAAIVGIGPFVFDAYTVNILIRSFLYASVALTVDVLWGYMGVLTFGQSAFFAIGAYAAGLTFTHYGFSEANAGLALAGGVVLAVIVAAVIGWLAFWHGASALYASVITLVLPIVATQILFSGGTFTGSSSGLSGFESFSWSTEQWFWITGGFLVVLTTLGWLFVNSDAGKILVAVRENEQRCKYLGIDTSRLKTGVFIAAAIVGAIAGYLYAGFTTVVAPELSGFVFGTELVIWVALGGRGTLLGPVLGTLLIDWSSAQLSGDFPFVWKLILGAVFVLVIVLFPRGVAPLVAAAARRVLPARWSGVQAEPPALLQRTGTQEPATPGAAAPALVIEDLSKHFGSLSVLTGITLTARAGQLVSLVGPNGAGKTTLMRCIADGAERSSGTVQINGEDIGRSPPEACVRLGVGRKFQTANVFDALTVRECLRIARARIDRPSAWSRAPELRLPEPALHVIEATGLGAVLDKPAHLLSHGQKQALELAMVLALEPGILLLDEPTAGLTKAERTLIGSMLVDLVERNGLCILLVEHDLEFVRQISSRVVVLHQGSIVLDGTVDEVVNSELVKAVYAGSGNAGPVASSGGAA